MKSKIKAIGRVSSESVLKGSGKNWDQWIAILDRAGARSLTHQEIVAWLKKKHKLTMWWQQGVTGGYEIHIGRRVEGQNLKGDYSVTVTKSLSVNQKTLWTKLWSPEGLLLWLKPMSDFTLKKKSQFEVEGGIFGEVRSFKAPLRARLSWQDSDWLKPTYLQIYVAKRPREKSILVFMHDGLKTAAAKEQMRKYWREAASRIHATF
jgi:hypothetical protein